MSKIMLYAIRSNLRSKTTQDEEQRIIYARQVVKSDLAKGRALRALLNPASSLSDRQGGSQSHLFAGLVYQLLCFFRPLLANS